MQIDTGLIKKYCPRTILKMQCLNSAHILPTVQPCRKNRGSTTASGSLPATASSFLL
jgi:hypothetical protein